MVLQKPIKHSILASDGGFLDDGVTGVTGTGNGSVLYFDASSQAVNLSSGNLGDVLTMGASVPEWASPSSGGQIELIDHTELTGSATEINTSFTSINGNDIACLLVYVNGVPDGANDIQCQIGSGGSLRTSNYYVEGQKIAGATQTLLNSDNASSFRVAQHEGANKAQTSVINIFVGDSTMSSSLSQVINYMVSGHSDAGASVWDNGSQMTTSTTSIDQIRIFVSSGNLLAGSSMSIFRVNNS